MSRIFWVESEKNQLVREARRLLSEGKFHSVNTSLLNEAQNVLALGRRRSIPGLIAVPWFAQRLANSDDAVEKKSLLSPEKKSGDLLIEVLDKHIQSYIAAEINKLRKEFNDKLQAAIEVYAKQPESEPEKKSDVPSASSPQLQTLPPPAMPILGKLLVIGHTEWPEVKLASEMKRMSLLSVSNQEEYQPLMEKLSIDFLSNSDFKDVKFAIVCEDYLSQKEDPQRLKSILSRFVTTHCVPGPGPRIARFISLLGMKRT
jgi:hypothetical protein